MSLKITNLKLQLHLPVVQQLAKVPLSYMQARTQEYVSWN